MKQRALSGLMVASLIAAWSGTVFSDEQWSPRGGQTDIAFEQAVLHDLGIEAATVDGELTNGFRFSVSGASNLLITASGGAFTAPLSGTIEHAGSVVLVGPAGEVELDGFSIIALADEYDTHWVVTAGRGEDKEALFTMDSVKIGFDRLSSRLLIETTDLTGTALLAELLGNPKLENRAIGGLRVAAQLVWTGGDAPIIPTEEEILAPVGEGGVAGGNNGTICPQPGGPDVIVGDLIDVSNYATVGAIDAFAVGTTSCNVGDTNLLWQASPDPDHPVIGQTMFRLKDGRFEQIGQSWLKHGFTALTENVCGCGCSGQGGAVLGVGCSDPYCCGLNGSQTGLGAKSQVNAYTGVFPGSHDTSTGNSVYKRLQVATSDLNPTLNSGALYFVEGHYIAADDAASGNGENNASYRRITVSGADPNYNIALADTTQREQPGIRAWKDNDPTVTETDTRISGEGLIIMSAKATDLGTGFYHYEYAVQNLNSDRSIGSFSVPLDAAATVQNIGFHDVPYHSGEPYDGTDWPGTFSGGAVSWATTPFATNANANALRWGTMYNFRFDANRAPTSDKVTLGLFKPGTPTSIQVSTVIPTSGPSDCNNNGIVDNCDVTCAGSCSGVVGCGQSDDCNANGVPDECETTDCNNNSIPDSCDIAAGTSNDCNTNGIPDECDTFSTTPITSVRVATGLSQPVFVGAPPGDSRLWIVEQTGAIKILSGGSVLGTPYLNIAALTSQGGERGLLGLAFDPNFNTNGRFYVNYTNTAGNTVVARYTATGGNPASNTADPATAVILKTITQDFANHNGGCLQFGPDGYLYVGMGDGGSANDPNGRGQDINSLLGKMLRLDVNNAPTYVPASNPFVGVAGADEIWAVGMRNPWRFSFDRLTGEMYIGDVGQDAHEEIDYEPAGIAGGRNYGWRCMEGTACTGLSGCTCNAANLTLPILDIAHATTPGVCSVTGGYVYRGCAIPDLQGTYFYADYCADFIKSFEYSPTGGLTNHIVRTAQLAPDLGAIQGVVSFGEDGFGELYYCSISNGGVYKIVPDTGPSCGNFVIEAGEECEPPNTATCDAFCQTISCVPASFTDTFETNLSWSVTNEAGLTSGAWTRVDPVGTAAQPEDDHTVSGTLCYVTGQGAVGGAIGAADVDGGYTMLISPTISLPSGGSISYWRWYNNGAGAAPNTETFRVDVSNNNGGSWVNVETVGPSGAETAGGWIQHEFNVENFVTPSTQIKVRFVAEDLVANGGSIVEAGVDDVQVFPADCNNNCVADSTDITLGNSEDCNTNLIPDECESGSQLKTYEITVSPAVSIPDGTGTFVSHTFNVPDSGTIQDVNLGLQLSHTWNGDLVVRVTHNATTVTLIDRPGLPAADPNFGFDNDGFDIILDDEGGGGSIEDANNAAGVVSPPNYVPSNPLSAFDGMDKQGSWIIEAADFVGSDTGSIDHWSLLINNLGSDPCPITDCNNNGVDDAQDISTGTSEDCNNNDVPDECDLASGTSDDCNGGPVGSIAGGASIFGTFCFGCHNNNGQGGVGFPGPNIRNKTRVQIWTMLLPPTTHPGGAHPEFDDQDFADLEAFLADNGSRGRPDRIPDECQSNLPNCDLDAVNDACELEAGTQHDVNYDGIPDECQGCTSNANCNDNLFCNGVETCNTGIGVCVPGTPPCTPLQQCDEVNNVCIDLPVFSCVPSSSAAAPGGSISLDLMLSGDFASLRGYEVRLQITRTSGTGSLAPTCPGGVQVDYNRPDYVFSGEQSFTGLDCDNLRAATGLISGVVVPDGTYYLADWVLDVSGDATPGSTFEIAFMPKPDSFLRDGAENPIPYAIDTPCVITITDCGPSVAAGGGARYIDVTPAPDTDPVAIRITGDASNPDVDCVDQYVQANGTLGAAAVYLTPAVWGTVHVHDSEIIPSANYLVTTLCGIGVGSSVSPPVSVDTYPWGDVNNSGAVNVDDLLCVISGFAGIFTFCTPQEVDLWGCTPDGIINIDDILRVVDAFGGGDYPCPVPCP